MPPSHILNAPTRLMRTRLWCGYAVRPSDRRGFSGQNYFPDAIPRQNFYQPPDRGFEREIRKRLEDRAKLRENKFKG